MLPLPIDPLLPRIRQAVLDTPAVIVQAPPGSGKTTRVPLALMEALPPETGRIILLEPRRIAAVAAARWMARTLGEEVGRTLGYSIRFDSRLGRETRIEVVTEGVLTRRLVADPTLEGVSLVIFDEFHERSLQTDLALALCLDCQRGLREDLRLVVMSATLDATPVARLLGDAPVLAGEGKAFPVEERFLEPERDRSLTDRVVRAVGLALRETAGDILVFLPGAGEIRRAAQALEQTLANRKPDLAVFPLYGDLPFAEQERAIRPGDRRRIVLATNIAETSLTIEGIGAVIDSGLSRRLQHDPATGMNRLTTQTVSRAAARQRQGRAGRLGPGICYRLYSRHTYEALTAYAPPEILTSDLSSLVLELAAWGVVHAAALPWLDPPPEPAWAAARRLLSDLGALDGGGLPTRLGRAMVRLPLHPRLAGMLLGAVDLDVPTLGADLAALLSERDILPSGLDLGERVAALEAWRRTGRPTAGGDPWALAAVARVARQLLGLVEGGRDKVGKKRHARAGSHAPKDETIVARLLLRAYPDRVARRREEGSGRFLLANGRGVTVGQASPLASAPFLVCARVDAGEGTEGRVHLAEAVSETMLRRDLANSIETTRRTVWDRREGRIVSMEEERLGALELATRPRILADGEAVPLLCKAIRRGEATLSFTGPVRQLQGRVRLLARHFPGEAWPDWRDEALLADPEGWLAPYLNGIRTQAQLTALDLLPALSARLSRRQQRRLDEAAPTAITVPSGRRIALDYTAGDLPVLAVKLQEMFGLGDTPAVADGRIPVLLHLLSPARRPVQITRDLRGFWNSGYEEVKRELRGRYPKHPWPEDPWNAPPTSRTQPKRR